MADAEPTSYKPLTFKAASQEDRKALAREVAKEWLNFLTGSNHSVSQWRKAGPVILEGKNNKGVHHSITITFNKVVDNVLEKHNFSLDEFDISDEKFTPWADPSGSAALTFYWANQATNWKPQSLSLGSTSIQNFPFTPGVDREGVVFNPLHPYLATMIIEARRRIVENADLMFKFDVAWLYDLLSFFNFSVSIVEGWLTLVYYKAKYDAQSAGLKFDAEKMGSIYNRRLVDKLAWVAHVSGRPLEGIDKEVRTFTALKEIRNHLNHFDPPFFAATIEDIASWMNMIFSTARLLWKMRKHLHLPPDRAIIQMLFQEHVNFVPQNSEIKRVPQRLGYSSCKWPVSK